MFRNHGNPIVYKVACNVSVQKYFLLWRVESINARGAHQSPKYAPHVLFSFVCARIVSSRSTSAFILSTYERTYSLIIAAYSWAWSSTETAASVSSSTALEATARVSATMKDLIVG